ncbi:myo-inositol-1-phosphate synthase [Amycolatopsis rhizosphaerae]|uniref:Myo-inositol-1-phosphate synthase n=1 Tax=Amycolatopsis rhizosphaerae TaxID=2053003 RepID=A0A558CJF1_9PSEU|nr:inositol-3-phosphate synthase [Amycolatopsis rhizosphaerae]TVT48883.1 myo-inositol-1-phosphate synthase [Amycolatopsis rhizosphaerae]
MGGTGVWLVGARGSVATTAIAGAAAIRAGGAPPTGCVAELPDFTGAGLPPLSDLVFGGHDVVDTPLRKRAEQLVRAGVLPASTVRLVADDLESAEAELRVADPDAGNTGPQAGTIARIVDDLIDFGIRNGLERTVVVNVASTEPPCTPHPAHRDLDALDTALRGPGPVLPPSSVYAYAAFRAGCGFVDFTPSTGARLPALHELALRTRQPYAGRDGKTGETLLRSVLAPMFARRGLDVLSWSGTNLLGGGDGATLADPRAAASKNASKQRVLERNLGGPVDGQVHIDYVPALGEWKTAWDHVLFEGFLGARMSLQLTWQGCDSALAAPLVLDLARFTAKACRAGARGPVPELGFFFKDPVGDVPHDLATQYVLLRDWAQR